MLTWSYMFWASVLYFLVGKWSKVWMKPSIKRRDQNHMFGQNVRYFVQIIKLGKKGFSGWHANVKQKISLKPRSFSLFHLYLCSIVLRFYIALITGYSSAKFWKQQTMHPVFVSIDRITLRYSMWSVSYSEYHWWYLLYKMSKFQCTVVLSYNGKKLNGLSLIFAAYI